MAMGGRIHWRVPATMLGGLIVATLLAAGHHLFCQWKHGQEVSTDAFLGSPVSKQQATIATSTAFAFLVQSYLVLAPTNAFIQLFWKDTKARRMTMATLNILYSAIHHLLSMFHIPIWWRHPLAMTVAATSWLIPFVAIFTPAALTIHTIAVSPSTVSSIQVPRIDFGSLAFVDKMPSYKSPANAADRYRYAGPSSVVLNVANAVMVQGSVLPIKAPAANASWQLEFFAPSLKCMDVSSKGRHLFQQNIYDYYLHTRNAEMYGFLGWIPRFGLWNRTVTPGVPFQSKRANGSIEFGSGLLSDPETRDMTIHIGILPHKTPHITRMPTPIDLPKLDNATLLACRVHNSTYHVAFEFINGQQDSAIDVSDIEIESPVERRAIILGPNVNPEVSLGCNSLPNKYADGCYEDPMTRSTLAYQAVLEAFSSNIIGSISHHFSGIDVQWSLRKTSKVLETTLSNSQDLLFLSSAGTRDTLQNSIRRSNLTTQDEVMSTDVYVSAYHFGEAMERLFNKVVVSLMSSPALQPNYTSSSAPSPVNVTLPKYHNVYIYSMWKLWVPYGIAILVAIVAAFIGLAAIYINEASYSDDFSTLARAARGAHFNPGIRDQDLSGEDPLPQSLLSAVVSFRSCKGRQKGGAFKYGILPSDPLLEAQEHGPDLRVQSRLPGVDAAAINRRKRSNTL